MFLLFIRLRTVFIFLVVPFPETSFAIQIAVAIYAPQNGIFVAYATIRQFIDLQQMKFNNILTNKVNLLKTKLHLEGIFEIIFL